MSLSKALFLEALDKSLKTFAQKIQVEEDYLTEGIRLCENVREVIEDDMGCQMYNSRSYFARSITVGTEPPFEVVHPDFAIILTFAYPPLTPLDDFEAEIQDILRQSKTPLEIAKIKNTSDIMCITFKNGMRTHLLVENITKDTDIDDLLQKIKHLGDSRRFHIVSLGLQHCKFMQMQTEVTILLAGLANYWLKSKGLSYGSGVKLIFELLAVAVVKEQEEGEGLQESMTSSFITLTKKLENLDQMQLAFTQSISGEISTCCVVGQAVPYLMEPCSQVPNNLLDESNIKREQMEVLMKTGKDMREDLEKFMEKSVFNVYVGSDGVEIDLEEFFKK